MCYGILLILWTLPISTNFVSNMAQIWHKPLMKMKGLFVFLIIKRAGRTTGQKHLFSGNISTKQWMN